MFVYGRKSIQIVKDNKQLMILTEGQPPMHGIRFYRRSVA